MPLPHPSTIARDKTLQNVLALEREGYSRNEAIVIAFNSARATYFKRFPSGLLPTWLAFPKGKRLSKDYLPNGAPIRREIYERNPRTSLPDEKRQAKRLYEGFTESEADFGENIEVPDFPVGVAIGNILGIIYETSISGEPKKFIHKFHTVNSRPALVVSHDGKSFRSVGGRFRFTKRGFVDGK